jgi:gliding motility-associated-like protein
MGDLNIKVTCPNGNSVNLHQYSGGGGTYIGEPIDFDFDLSPGTGYDYCWSDNASETWTQAVLNGNTISVNGKQTLPTGFYLPSDPFSNLIGCPLNGNWAIEICDNLAVDNGYIFSWELDFDSSFSFVDTLFIPSIASSWQPHSSILSDQGDTLMVVPNSTTTYTFQSTDLFGCQLDTVINIAVSPFTNLDCFNCDSLMLTVSNDTTIAQGDSIQLHALASPESFQPLEFNRQHLDTIPTNINLDIPIQVSNLINQNINIGDISSVCIDVNHNSLEDIDIFLIAPSGEMLELTSDNSGTAYSNTCFIPNATSNITTGTSPYTGNFLPEGSWSILNGATTNGTWILRITDDNIGIDGTISNVSILFANNYNVTYSWTPSQNLSCTDCPNPIAFPSLATTYSVTVVDDLGCSKMEDIILTVDTSTSIHAIKDSEAILYVATGFTPNGDGINDFLYVQGNQQVEKVISFLVYNRLGEQVFYKNDFPINRPEEGWNGYFRNNVAPSSLYSWVAEIKLLNGQQIKLNGNTNLIR